MGSTTFLPWSTLTTSQRISFIGNTMILAGSSLVTLSKLIEFGELKPIFPVTEPITSRTTEPRTTASDYFR